VQSKIGAAERQVQLARSDVSTLGHGLEKRRSELVAAIAQERDEIASGS
jgi:hypothetical protein